MIFQFTQCGMIKCLELDGKWELLGDSLTKINKDDKRKKGFLDFRVGPC